MKYNNEELKAMCQKVNLLEYASQSFVFENKSGDNWFTHCPLHVDKTPSLSINAKDNYFYCFSCGKTGSIINWLMVFENMKYQDAIEKTARLSGTNLSTLQQCDCMAIYRDMKRKRNKDKKDCENRQILSDDEINKFKDEIPHEWIDEGISPDVMRLFDIKVDPKHNRIVYPIRDNNLQLIGFKGRTRFSNYKDLKISKYMNYNKIHTTDFFVGMKENRESILRHKSVIIVEGIKSVMKLYDWGYDYCLAAETSTLNDSQIDILLQMKLKDIIIGFDSDVKIDKIRNCTKRLQRFCNVYVIRDKHGLLDEKMSPCDKGREVFETLYKERIKL